MCPYDLCVCVRVRVSASWCTNVCHYVRSCVFLCMCCMYDCMSVCLYIGVSVLSVNLCCLCVGMAVGMCIDGSLYGYVGMKGR